MSGTLQWGLDWMVSVDDHVLEPPDLWQSRVPRALRDRAPKLVNDDEGEAWILDGTRYATYGLNAVAGKSAEEFSPEPLTYAEMRPGCFQPAARLADMDEDHIIASLCFPSFPRFAGQLFSVIKDRELGLACVRAYNDWMIDEWAGSSGGRLIPLTIAPLWDPKMAAAEVERCVSKGAKAVAFSENPEPLGFPSVHDFDYWHPLFSAVEDAGIPVCTHIGSSSKIRTPSSDCPPIGSIAYMVLAASAATLIDWLFGGHFLRYPRIKLCLSEGGIGWMPYVLERAEQVYDKQRHWYRKMDAATSKGKLLGTQSVETNQNVIDLIDSGIRPTELFRDHVYGCFFDDRAGVEMLDAIGEDNVMVESDYPHSDSNWPNTMDVISPQIKGLNETTQRKLLQLNAVRVFDLELPPPPSSLIRLDL